MRYLSIAEVFGLQLEKNTVLQHSYFTLTNSADFIITNFIKDYKSFVKHFGEIAFRKLHDEDICYFLHYVENDESDFIIKSNNIVDSIFQQLWKIKDSSIQIPTFYFISQEIADYICVTANIRNFNAVAEYLPIKFNSLDFKSIIDWVELGSTNIEKKENIHKSIGNINHSNSHKNFHHNDLNRITRAELFLYQARRSYLLPLRITNYIGFIECLFSTNGSEISHQVSERVAFFISTFDKDASKREIYREMKIFYGIRSKYMHGDKLDKSAKNNELLNQHSVRLDEICRKISNLIRTNDIIVFNNDNDLQQYFLELIFQN